jgi:galactokinase
VDALQQEYLSRFPVAGDAFRLRDRAEHVFGEAARVHAFAAACTAGGPDDVTTALGALMNASQHSCATLFTCSCPELDRLVALARHHGALGARLTGAGWGGCTVSLVRRGTEDAFIAAMLASYNDSDNGAGGLRGHPPGDVVFATLPGSGAGILVL